MVRYTGTGTGTGTLIYVHLRMAGWLYTGTTPGLYQVVTPDLRQTLLDARSFKKPSVETICIFKARKVR